MMKKHGLERNFDLSRPKSDGGIICPLICPPVHISEKSSIFMIFEDFLFFLTFLRKFSGTFRERNPQKIKNNDSVDFERFRIEQLSSNSLGTSKTIVMKNHKNLRFLWFFMIF